MSLSKGVGLWAVLVVICFSAGASLGRTLIADSAQEICPLLPGAKVPSVELLRLDGSTFDLLQEVTERRSILVFYRGGW